ncbi:MAG TPA: hypothetical protein P5569_12040 [Candidatus Latescibacteria bacterium]|nr:hypothetical protein [Candidatus Latescibacterota bacterium]
MSLHIPPEATEGAYGRITLDAKKYRPLDTVTATIHGRAQGDHACTVRVCDPEQRPYLETRVVLSENHGSVSFAAAGKLGAHYVYLIWEGETRHSRFVNFQLEAETCIESGDADFDGLYAFTKDAMRQGRREYDTPDGKLVGYISADTWHLDGIWLRDWIYGLPAYRWWERDMQCGLDRFLDRQEASGMLHDGIERDGRTWRVGLESDVEYIMVLAVWQTWQATGDDEWMARALPKLERALKYIRNDPLHWDEGTRLVKRQHSCDTWDFDIDGASDKGNQRHVIATCDQSGYYLAFRAMAAMYRYLGLEFESEAWEGEAEEYRRRADALLWDGTKYLHHHHVDEIDHADFDERDQLAMGNTWAMTRGMAQAGQARSIIDEYRRRHAETGDAYPWWSLQPGYPDHLGYFKAPFLRQGGYANGGLMPWVGGELCRAAFLFGRERYGVDLLRAYADHLRRTGGAHVWYWPNGETGFRTTNEVPYASWGMAEWLNAAVEGFAGIHDDEALFRQVTLSPRWAAAGVGEVRVCARYAASKGYVAYRFRADDAKREIRFTCTGSGQAAYVRVLLPEGWEASSARCGGQEVELAIEIEDASRYVCFAMPLDGQQEAVIACG